VAKLPQIERKAFDPEESVATTNAGVRGHRTADRTNAGVRGHRTADRTNAGVRGHRIADRTNVGVRGLRIADRSNGGVRGNSIILGVIGLKRSARTVGERTMDSAGANDVGAPNRPNEGNGPGATARTGRRSVGTGGPTAGRREVDLACMEGADRIRVPAERTRTGSRAISKAGRDPKATTVAGNGTSRALFR